MVEQDDPAEAAQRLERALERIARLARPGGQDIPDAAATARIAARLDTLIAQLRAALGPTTGG